MAMIKCDECGKDISDKAAACIACGAPIDNVQNESVIGDSAKELGRGIVKNDLLKDVAAAAACGALIAVPIPVIGPIAGATIGASLGFYRYITKR